MDAGVNLYPPKLNTRVSPLVSLAGAVVAAFVAAEFGAHLFNTPVCPLAYVSGERTHAGNAQVRLAIRPDARPVLFNQSPRVGLADPHTHIASRSGG